MKCKDCSKEIVGDEFRKVADWVFCLNCFDKLLAKAAEDSSSESESVPVEPEAGAHCTTCGCRLADNQGNKVGIWLFCDKCHGELVYQKPPPPAVKPTPEVAPEPPPEPIGRVAVQMQIKVKCQGCGRQIFQAGANIYRDNPYCPDCYYASGDAGQASDKGPAASDQGGTASKDLNCESCERQLSKEDCQLIEGFNLCPACVATDMKLAV